MVLEVKLEEMLTEIRKNQEFVRHELSSCPPGTLLKTIERGKVVYYHDIWINEKRQRKRLSKHPQMIALLARKEYLLTQQKLLETNIATLEKAMQNFCDITPQQILRQLPEKYGGLPQELFFPQRADTPEGRWESKPYIQSDYMPERKVHLTSRGLSVRSKSEVLIAEKLYEFNLPFRYEQVMHINGYNLAPDFTILSRSGEEFIWEHCGLTGNPKYMKHHKWKMELYESAGIVPWKNLIVTYDNEQGNIDLAIIESEIRNKLL